MAGNPLIDALMGTILIVVVSKSPNDPPQLLLVEDEEMVTTLSFQRAHKSFLDGIGSRGLEGSSQLLDP